MDNNLHWCAGFFQGEGYCGISSQKRVHKEDYKFAVIKITQYYDPEPLLLFKEVFNAGNVLGPYEKSRGDTGVYQYAVSGEPAELIIEKLIPMLYGKKLEQARKTIQEINSYKKISRPMPKAKKTHCPSGHNYQEYGKIGSKGYWICKPCHAEQKRKLRAKKGKVV